MAAGLVPVTDCYNRLTEGADPHVILTAVVAHADYAYLEPMLRPRSARSVRAHLYAALAPSALDPHEIIAPAPGFARDSVRECENRTVDWFLRFAKAGARDGAVQALCDNVIREIEPTLVADGGRSALPHCRALYVELDRRRITHCGPPPAARDHGPLTHVVAFVPVYAPAIAQPPATTAVAITTSLRSWP